jgi:hypothetical protein
MRIEISTPESEVLREIHAAGWPPLAPMLQLTCRPGTPQQKTWQLRRAVTILGSRPSAHIVLRHDEVSRTHAAVICDGTDPIVCDLVSRNGTSVGGERVRGAALEEGDEIRIGPYGIRVHIQPRPGSRGRNSESGQFQAILPGPDLRLVDAHGQTVLSVHEGAAVIGTREGADLRVECETQLPAVAIVMAWRRGWALYDLTHEAPQTELNGKKTGSAVLHRGDCLAIGRCTFEVALDGDGPPEMDAATLINGSGRTQDSDAREPACRP